MLNSDRARYAIKQASRMLRKNEFEAAFRHAYIAAIEAPARVPVRALEVIANRAVSSSRVTRAQRWNMIGLAHYRAGAVGQANLSFRRALDLKPHDDRFTSRLGLMLWINGERQEAEALLEGALGLDPTLSESRLTLAQILCREGNPGRAIKLLSLCVGNDKDNRDRRIIQMAYTLLGFGVEGNALACVLLARIDNPRRPIKQLVAAILALSENRANSFVPFASFLNNGDFQTPLAIEQRVLLSFDLGDAAAKRGEQEHAFTHWIDGHRIMSLTQPFDRTAVAGFFEASIRRYSAEFISGAPRARNEDPLPVFIVGMPRSGTTLTEQILDMHSTVHGAGELRMTARFLEAHLGSAENADLVARATALGADDLESYARSLLAELRTLAPDASRIIDKMPGNFRYVGLLAALFPGARFIHCERDPRDIGLSIFRRRFFGYHPYAHNLEDLGWYIGQHSRLMAHWKCVYPDRILTVRLSEWTTDLEGTVRRICAFLAIPFEDACIRFYQNERLVETASRQQVRQPINMDGIGRWVDFKAQLQPLTEALVQLNILSSTLAN